MTSGIKAATLLAGVGGAGLLLATPQAVRAQAGIVPLRLKVGILTPQDGATRDRVGTPIFAAEADLRLPSTGSGAQTYIGIGYQERRSGSGDLRVVPITVARLYSPSNPAGGITGNLYYGVGTGIYVMHGSQSPQVFGTAPFSANGGSQNVTRLGGFAVVGYQSPASYFVEAKYQITAGSVNGMRPNGILILVGKRL